LDDSAASGKRDEELIPIIFDFKELDNRRWKDTIKVLGGLCRFVIADVTDPKAIGYELSAIVPQRIPVVPIIVKGEKPFHTLEKLRRKYWWLLSVASYASKDDLLENFATKVIDRAFKAEKRLMIERA
jgi:hypothetical protein